MIQDKYIRLGSKGKTCSKCKTHYLHWEIARMDQPSEMWGFQLTCRAWDRTANEVCGGTMAWDFMTRDERRAYLRKQLTRGAK